MRMDKISLAWALMTILLGLTALLRSKAIGEAMKRVHSQSQMHKVLTEKELRERTTLYIRLFGVVWILCGLFWVFWIVHRSSH